MVPLACLAALLLAGARAHDMPTVASVLKQRGPDAFVFNPVALGANATLKSAGGLSQPRQKKQWPQLEVGGISQTFFRLDACALRPPHAHPYASGLLYLISGGNFTVGLVTEDGTPAVNTITTGASALFPQGLIHYQQNMDCQEAVYTISYNAATPGTQVTLQSLFALPAPAVGPVLGLNASAYAALLAGDKADSAFVTMTDPDCMSRCKAQLAQAPSGANAGRKLL